MERMNQIPERQRLLDAVDAIAPRVRESANQAERDRHLPASTVDALDEAGILQMMWPRSLGGYEADPLTQHEVIARLAYHDASTAWCAFIGAGSSAFAAGNIPDEGLEEVSSSMRAKRSVEWARVAGSPNPSGQAVPCDGGYRVSGRWGWLSGVHHADWVFVGSPILRDGQKQMNDFGMPESLLFVVPIEEVVIEDSWMTAGLSGTGSAHVHTENLFVPVHRTIAFPFNTPKRGGPLFNLPTLGFFGPAFSGFPQGVGRRALDEIIDLAGRKNRMMAGSPLSERGAFQRDLGVMHDRLRSAERLVHFELDRLWHGLLNDEPPTPLESAELMSAFTTNAEAALAATELAYRYSGGDGVFLESPFQRQVRDMRVASQHILIGEYNYEGTARALLEKAAPQPQVLSSE